MRTLTAFNEDVVIIEHLVSIVRDKEGIIATVDTGQQVRILNNGALTDEELQQFLFYLHIDIMRSASNEIHASEVLYDLQHDNSED